MTPKLKLIAKGIVHQTRRNSTYFYKCGGRKEGGFQKKEFFAHLPKTILVKSSLRENRWVASDAFEGPVSALVCFFSSQGERGREEFVW